MLTMKLILIIIEIYINWLKNLKFDVFLIIIMQTLILVSAERTSYIILEFHQIYKKYKHPRVLLNKIMYSFYQINYWDNYYNP